MSSIGVALRKYVAVLTVAGLACLVNGCGLFGSSDDPHPAPPPTTADQSRVGPLEVGDGVEIDFSGSPNPMPSVRTEIKGDGTIHLDYINDVVAAGKTPGELEKEILQDYVPKYYTHLSVTVTPSGRFFFVDGEVMAPGRILFNGPMTVTRGIAAAAGFNPFADKRHVKLYRVNAKKALTINCVKALDHPELDIPVYPGDKIFVNRRLY